MKYIYVFYKSYNFNADSYVFRHQIPIWHPYTYMYLKRHDTWLEYLTIMMKDFNMNQL